MIVRFDPKAQEAGFAAGRAGEFSNSCPHPAMSIESLSWHCGFIAGKAKHKIRGVPCMARFT